MNGKLGRTWNELVVAYYKILGIRLEGPKKTTETLVKLSMSRKRFGLEHLPNTGQKRRRL
jgi:hypothetical protein